MAFLDSLAGILAGYQNLNLWLWYPSAGYGIKHTTHLALIQSMIIFHIEEDLIDIKNRKYNCSRAQCQAEKKGLNSTKKV